MPPPDATPPGAPPASTAPPPVEPADPMFRERVRAVARGYARRLQIRHWLAPAVLRAYFAHTKHTDLIPSEGHAEWYTTRFLERALPLLRSCGPDLSKARAVLGTEGDGAQEARALLDEVAGPDGVDLPGTLAVAVARADRENSAAARDRLIECAQWVEGELRAALEPVARALTEAAWPAPEWESNEPSEPGAPRVSRIGCVIEYKRGRAQVRFPDAEGPGIDRGGRPTQDTAFPFCPFTHAAHFEAGGANRPAPGDLSVPASPATLALEDYRGAAYRSEGAGDLRAGVLAEVLRPTGYTGAEPLLPSGDRVCTDPKEPRVAFAPGVLFDILRDLWCATRALPALHATAGFAADLAHEFRRLSFARLDLELPWNVSYLANMCGTGKAFDLGRETARLLGVAAADMSAQLPAWWAYVDHVLRYDPVSDLTAAGLGWTAVPTERNEGGEETVPDLASAPTWRLRAQRRQAVDVKRGPRRLFRAAAPTLFFEAFLRSLYVRAPVPEVQEPASDPDAPNEGPPEMRAPHDQPPEWDHPADLRALPLRQRLRLVYTAWATAHDNDLSRFHGEQIASGRGRPAGVPDANRRESLARCGALLAVELLTAAGAEPDFIGAARQLNDWATTRPVRFPDHDAVNGDEVGRYASEKQVPFVAFVLLAFLRLTAARVTPDPDSQPIKVTDQVTHAVCRDYRRIRQQFDRSDRAKVRGWVAEILKMYTTMREQTRTDDVPPGKTEGQA